MQTEYISNLNNNYIRLKVKYKPEQKSGYQYRIITTRRLEGLLTVNMHFNDGEQFLSYNISSMQSMSRWFLKKKITMAWMENLISCMQVARWSLKEYLLEERNLILSPDCIFQSMENDKIYFLYYPYYMEEKKDMEDFLTFLVENVDEEEKDALEMLYAIFSKWEGMREQFTIDTFFTLWDNHKKQMEQKIELPQETERSKVLADTVTYEAKGHMDKKAGRKRDIGEFFFGKYRNHKMEEYKPSMAMEHWEYQVKETPGYTEEPEHEREEAPADEEADSEKEERKLYGVGRQNRKVISLDKLPLVIGGKSEVADVILADISISKMHARLTEEKGQVFLEDLNAANGTFKNNVRLRPYEKVELLREDEIKLGNLCFTYR